MKKIIIQIVLPLFFINAYAQEQLSNFGNFRVFQGTAITSFGDFKNNGTLTVDSSSTLTINRTLNTNGIISNSGTYAYGDSAALTYSGTSRQTAGAELPNLNGPPTVTINNSSGVILGTDATISSLTFTSGNLIINGRTLTIDGIVTNTSGNISSDSTSSLNITGSAGTINFDQTNSSTRSLNNFTLNKSSSTLTLGNPVEVVGTLTLSNGTLATGGNLKLVSNADGTARVAAITGTGTITGNAVIERFVPSSARRWRFMSSPILSATIEDWRNEIFVTGAGTGNTVGTVNSNGFDATATNSPSIFYYDETVSGNLNSGWIPPLSTGATLPIGKGYRVFIRGDRSSQDRLTGVDMTQNAVTMNLTGTINTGDITMPVTYTNYNVANDDGWNLIGNPYPSQYDWNSFWNSGNSGNNGTNYSNISPTIYVWDATSNTYKSFNALANTGTITDGIIASGQGFFVKATGASPAMTFKESFKSSGVPIKMFKTSTIDEMQISLTLDSINVDDFILKYNQVSTSIDDKYDIRKWANPTVNISGFSGDTIPHALDSRPLKSGDDTILLNITGTDGVFVLKINLLPASGKFYFLQDLYLSNAIPLFEGSQYSFSIQSADTMSQGKNRFRIISSDSIYLPGSFGIFDAIKVATQVQLNWNTISEFNTTNFEIERGSDNILFNTIGNLKANGNSQITTNYLFTDTQPIFSSANFYRIKLFDANGFFKYSVVRMVSFTTGITKLSSEKFSVYPNPAKEIIVINFEHSPSYDCMIYIYSLTGNIVRQEHVAESGKTEISLNNLSKGIYFIRVVDNTGNAMTEKLLIE